MKEMEMIDDLLNAESREQRINEGREEKK